VLRSALRAWNDTNSRDFTVGLRVVRTLSP
jgi:hypothetical protein